jgi:hypothetical protein
MRAVCGSKMSYTASFTYRVLRRPFAAGRVASPLSLDKDERPLSLDTFVTSDNPWSSKSLSDLTKVSRDKGDVEDERSSLALSSLS